MILNFKSWDSHNPNINEEFGVNKIYNWLSSNFGGTVSKIDSLLSDAVRVENDYLKEWNQIQTDIDALQLKKAQVKNDPAEAKKLERMVENNQRLLNALSKKRRTSIDKINSKVEDLIKDKPRLISYWNLKKTELEAEIAEDLYNLAKKFTDETIADELYDKYKDAVIQAKKKDQNFREIFGKLDFSQPIRDFGKEDELDFKEDIIFSTDKILSMSISDFTKYAEKLSKAQVKKLVIFLISRRNDLYVDLDKSTEKIEASTELYNKREISQNVKELRETMMPKIRDLRTKITIARRYD